MEKFETKTSDVFVKIASAERFPAWRGILRGKAYFANFDDKTVSVFMTIMQDNPFGYVPNVGAVIRLLIEFNIPFNQFMHAIYEREIQQSLKTLLEIAHELNVPKLAQEAIEICNKERCWASMMEKVICELNFECFLYIRKYLIFGEDSCYYVPCIDSQFRKIATKDQLAKMNKILAKKESVEFLRDIRCSEHKKYLEFDNNKLMLNLCEILFDTDH